MKQKIVTNLNLLKVPCTQVAEGENIDNLLQDLRDTLAGINGYGLAVNQIGINKQVAIYLLEGVETILINPRIVEKGAKTIHWGEGCLSFPGVRVDTDRYKDLVVENGGKQFSVDSLEALIIQHEIDHLRGITIFDRKHRGR